MRRLLDAGLVLAAGEEGGYSFNHSLVQEAAYESVSRSRRQALHHRIASVLEAQADAQTASAPEIVAHHFGRASEPEKSCTFWILAAEKSGRRSAYAEAIANLNAALAEAERIADAATQARCKIDVQLRAG